ncbi:hypothetical protein [Flavobacterium crassostreae]|uniref:Uncharacterized protein n=1 Tax=Flavobacterium crassostreae TaxID=1763534 RepID=A0A1B9E4L5_9FLAO|nr:hypothetical protein [Flavobacterium crassostreae]OCB76875.1 hypothetical protein LPBF_05530 [Flavobacterium crassostreae]
MKYLKLVLLLVAIQCGAQNVTLKWAEKIKTKQAVAILGGKNGNYFTRHIDKDKKLVCRSYDKDLNFKDEKIVNFNLDNKRQQYQGAYFLKDKIVHFIRENVRKEDKDYLYAGITDLNLKTSEKTYVLDEADDDALIFGQRSISPDSTKVVVYHEIKGKKKEPNTLNFKVYNTDFTKVILQKSEQLPIKAKNFLTEEIKVDNLGNVYVLAKIYKEKDEKEKDLSKYYYKLIVFNKESQHKEFDFDYPNKDIESIGILPGENNTFICTGFLKVLDKSFFGSGKKALISDELFATIIDCKTGALKSSKKYELEGLYPEKPKKTQDYVPYEVRNIFFKKDGGAVVVAEQYKLVVVTTSNKYGSSTSYNYYYCDIACIQINSKSEVQSVSKMPKYQLNAANPSIITTYVNGTTFIVYEDLEKNANAENDKETKRSTNKMFSSSSKNALFLVAVAPSGEMKKEVIYSYKDSKIRPNIFGSKVINKNEILLNANDQIGLLKITK